MTFCNANAPVTQACGGMGRNGAVDRCDGLRTRQPAARHGFDPSDRQLLLSTPGIGPVVVARLEAIGCFSLAEVGERGVDAVVAQVTQLLGSAAWGNRRAALVRAMERARA